MIKLPRKGDKGLVKLAKSPYKEMNYMLIAICLGPFFSLMSIGVINVSLPNLSIIFDKDLQSIQWVTLGYLLVIPVLIPIMGKLADNIGHKLIHNLGYVVFGLSSILIAISPSVFFVFLFRALQGIGAAMFQATNISIISMNVPSSRRGKALGILGSAVGVGSMVGPAFGGVLIHWFPWQVAFLFPVPFCLLGYLLAQKYIPKNETKRKKTFDIFGAIQFSLIITLVMIGISFWHDWIGIVKGVFAIGIILLFLFTRWWLSHIEEPFLDLSVLKHQHILLGIFISFATYVGSFTVLVILPFHLQGILFLDPYWIGLIMMSYPIVLAITGPIFGSVSDRYGHVLVIFIGLILMCISLVAMVGIGRNGSFIIATLLLSLLGLGMGMITSPNYSYVMKFAPKEMVGMVGGLIALARTIGMAFGATLGFVIMNVWIPNDLGDVTNLLSDSNNEILILFALKGFNVTYVILGVLTLCSAIWVWLIQRKYKP